jgi:hypothetical protein
MYGRYFAQMEKKHKCAIYGFAKHMSLCTRLNWAMDIKQDNSNCFLDSFSEMEANKLFV